MVNLTTPYKNFICTTVFERVKQGCPTFFDLRAILAHQKYWQAKQTIHFNFRPKIKVFFKKIGLHLNSASYFSIFVPKSRCSLKKKDPTV